LLGISKIPLKYFAHTKILNIKWIKFLVTSMLKTILIRQSGINSWREWEGVGRLVIEPPPLYGAFLDTSSSSSS